MKFLFILLSGLFFPEIVFCHAKPSYYYSLSELIGDINPNKDPRFSLVHTGEGLYPNKSNIFLQKPVIQALEKVSRVFQKRFPGTPFSILSGMRGFLYQEGIWNRKWKSFEKQGYSGQKIRDMILQYSSMPGTSRHHWGSDVDLIFINSKDFQTPEGREIYYWMQIYLPKYGFRQCYSKGRKGGYDVEEWHWSYIPISRGYIRSYERLLDTSPQVVLRRLRNIRGLSMKDISNEELELLVKEYVLDVDKDCL